MTDAQAQAHTSRAVGLPLVGRDAALAGIRAALDRARASHGELVLITGEAGIGKTRLAAEVFNAAPGFTTVWSWCVSDPAGSSFRPWLQVVQELASANTDVARVVAASPQLAGLISRAGPTGDALRTDETIRWQLFDAVATVLRTAAASTPVLIVLDDLHAAQESSMWLLAHLAAGLRSSAVLLLATARDGEHAWHDHVEVRAAIVRQVTAVHLLPLSEQQVGELMAHVNTDMARRSVLAERIHARTGGNPLLVSELIRPLGEQPPLEGNRSGSAFGATVPASVRAITAERLFGCNSACQRLVAVAAVLGTRFGLDALADVVEMDLGTARGVLVDAETIGILEFPEPGSGRFVHELIRDAVYDRLSSAERSGWHARAASVLTNFARRGRAIAPAEIAHHLLLAGPDVANEAAELAQLAGDRAAAVLAFEDAVAWYERALRAFDRAAVDRPRRALLLLALGDARRGCGDRAGARAEFLQSAELARQADMPELLARAALGLGAGPSGFEVELMDRQQLDLLEEASAGLPEELLVLRALVLARLSVAATTIDSEERRLALAHDALRLARQASDDAAQAYALSALCDALAGPEYTAERLAHASEIVQRATHLRNPALELLGRRLRLVALLEAGDRPAAEAESTAYRLRAEAFGHPLYTWYVPLWRATWALAEGRFDECRTLNALAADQGTSAGSHNAVLLTITQRWCLLAEREDRDELRQLLARVDFEQEDVLWVRITGALILAQLGESHAARQRLDALAPRLTSLPRDSEWLASISQVAELIALVGAHPVAQWIYGVLRPFADLFVIEGIGAAIRGPVQRYLAIAAAAVGDHELARSHAASAVEAAQRLGAPALVERIQNESLTWSHSVSTALAEPELDGSENVFRRAGDVWALGFRGHAIQLRDSKGLQDLAVLLARPGVHVAALDLAGSDAARADSNDAGEVLDAAARDAYRRRLIELEEEASEADAAGDIGRSTRIATERESLVEQLTAAYGLGGRARRVGSSAERARTAVTARVRDAIRRIAAAHPELGQHLLRSVRTGTFCVYEPETPVRWHTEM
jgi:hypothetical protein